MGQKPRVKNRITFKYGKIPKSWHKCLICEVTKLLTVHHIQPQCKGGSNFLFNLMILCRKHHDEVEGQGHYARNRSKTTINKYNRELSKRGLIQWKI